MATKKGASKKGSSKRSGKGSDVEGFTAGDRNDNVRDISETAGTSRRSGRAEQIDLIEDRKIPELDRAARDHAAIRDERMALTAREVTSKANLKGLMKKHKKEEYTCDGIEIRIVHIDEEDVKVKVAKEPDAD
jgi:hypothetical protein